MIRLKTIDDWPDLTLSSWEDTRDTVHMWTQIVGKVRLALEPMVNHWWQVALYVSARGLTTSLMPAGTKGLEIEFDFVDHVLDLRMTDGRVRQVALEPRSVASFYRATMRALDELEVHVQFLPRPVEVAESIPFAQDEAHHAYDTAAVQRFWLALVQIHRVMTRFHGRFIGKSSPVHFFWGGPDLAVTRFSGRPAPKHPGGVPHCADWVQELAYSHEVSSCGFWPGGSAEGSFYSYAYPQPAGFADWAVSPRAAFYDHDLGEFLLPYTAVRTAEHPDAALLSFFESTYEGAATLARWDRAALELAPRRALNHFHISGGREGEGMTSEGERRQVVVDATAATEASMRTQTVPVNVFETTDAVVVVAPLPAVTPHDVTIELSGPTLRFWAHLRSAAPRNYLVHEWEYGGYERVIELPAGYGRSVEASLGSGQLAIRVLRGDATSETLTAKPRNAEPD